MGFEIMAGEFALEVAIGFFVWLIANWAYLDFRRNGIRGFKRVVAFFMGWPTTFLTLLLVVESRRPRIKDDDEGLEELVREIRRDRLVREGWDDSSAVGPGREDTTGEAVGS